MAVSKRNWRGENSKEQIVPSAYPDQIRDHDMKWRHHAPVFTGVLPPEDNRQENHSVTGGERLYRPTLSGRAFVPTETRVQTKE